MKEYIREDVGKEISMFEERFIIMRNRIKKKKKKVQSMDPTIKSQSGCYLELSESDCYLLGEGTIERRENDTIHLIFQDSMLSNCNSDMNKSRRYRSFYTSNKSKIYCLESFTLEEV
ncbi:hypothetical protein HKD37_01G000065 [Glycine soja]